MSSQAIEQGIPSYLHGHWNLVNPRLWRPLTFFPFLLLSACQLNCSDHGHCDSFTKRCICDPFWMENFIKVQLRDGDSNCGEFSAWNCASWFGVEYGSELSGWVLVFPRQMSNEEKNFVYFLFAEDVYFLPPHLLKVRGKLWSSFLFLVLFLFGLPAQLAGS